MAWCYWALAGYEADMSAITHTHQLPFIRLRNRQKQTKIKCACKESTQIALPFANFRSLVRGGWRRRNFVAPQAGSTAFGIRCSESNAKIRSYELVFGAPRDHVHRQYQP
jgi:hypothetical protein